MSSDQRFDQRVFKACLTQKERVFLTTSHTRSALWTLLAIKEFGDIMNTIMIKVIREKSRGEGSLIVQDTIENVSEPKFFF